MREFVLLDSGPLGLACRRPRSPLPDHCRQWFQGLILRGVGVVIPEIADYEVRRDLTRIGADTSLRRLDDLVTTGGLSTSPRPQRSGVRLPCSGLTPANAAYCFA